MATDFGRDTSCTTGRRTGRLVSGARLVGEAIFRRLSTPRGRLRGGKGEQNYGLDLSDLIGEGTSKAKLRSFEQRIATEAEKDERVRAAEVTVVDTSSGPGVELTISVVGRTADGPFTLRIGVTEATVALLDPVDTRAA